MLSRTAFRNCKSSRSSFYQSSQRLSSSSSHQSNAQSKRPPFHEIESSRPAFETQSYTITKAPDPKWKVGNGLVDVDKHARASEFDAKRAKEVKRAEELSEGENYKLIVGGVIPRPIAFVSSQDSQGRRNLAPFSYFGAVGHKPPMVMISMNMQPKGGEKDSAANIIETKRFTVNLISEPFVEAANWTSVDAPHDISEWALSGLTPVQSSYWGDDPSAPPRVGESAFSMECDYHDSLKLCDDDGIQTGTIIVGRIRAYVMNEGILQNDGSISPDDLLPIARGGGITYLRSISGFELPRPRWEKERETDEVREALEKTRDEAS